METSKLVDQGSRTDQWLPCASPFRKSRGSGPARHLTQIHGRSGASETRYRTCRGTTARAHVMRTAWRPLCRGPRNKNWCNRK